MSRNSIVGIATRYRLDGPGIESRWRLDISAPVQTGAGAHPVFYTMVTGSFPGVKRLGRGVEHPPHLAPRVKSTAIHLFHFSSIVACSRVNFTLHIGGRSSIRNVRTRHAVVTGTHLSRNSLHIKRRNAEWICLVKGVTEGRSDENTRKMT